MSEAENYKKSLVLSAKRRLIGDKLYTTVLRVVYEVNGRGEIASGKEPLPHPDRNPNPTPNPTINPAQTPYPIIGADF